MENDMTSYPDHMDRDEARIIGHVLRRILEHPDLFIRVYDGEEWATGWTRDRKRIEEQTAATDETRYFIARVADTGGMQRIGSILCIHGNGEDVISDYSWNPKADNAEAMLASFTNEGA